jgi:hypothetical protein
LNLNATKFKLTQLKQHDTRYEVIYKNLIRDLRKYIVLDFNQLTNMKKKKRCGVKPTYLENVKTYIN